MDPTPRLPAGRAALAIVGVVAILAIALVGAALLGSGRAGPSPSAAAVATSAAATSASAPANPSPSAAGSATPATATPAVEPSLATPEHVAERLDACEASGSTGLLRTCYEVTLEELVSPAQDPRPIVAAIAEHAWDEPGFLLGNCHGLMHTVGRTYVARHGVTLETLMDYLPANNDPGCPAGFSHGLATGVAPQIDLSRPEDTARICDAAGTRYREYSCIHGFGHAFMRLVDEELDIALRMCSSLGDAAAPDCAQGAYHDYWFAAIGFDDAQAPPDAVTDPRELCTAQPEPFVRACWYRAFVDTRPPGLELRSGAEIADACTGLEGLQRSACISAASVIGPPDPVNQLQLCLELADPADQASCIRGAKVQNLLREPPEAYVDLIGRCALFEEPTAGECYRWLGRIISVVTDGAFEATGCPQIASPAGREACVEGARAIEEPLETFS